MIRARRIGRWTPTGISILCSFLLAGCFLNRAGTRASEDSGVAIDARSRVDSEVPPVDSGSRVDAGPAIDAGVLEDGGGLDASPPDAGRDAGAPDAGPVDAGVSCDDLYAGARSYRLCADRTAECEFYSFLDGDNCSDQCGRFGGTCLGRYNSRDPAVGRCERGHPDPRSCSTSLPAAICVCSRL